MVRALSRRGRRVAAADVRRLRGRLLGRRHRPAWSRPTTPASPGGARLPALPALRARERAAAASGRFSRPRLCSRSPTPCDRRHPPGRPPSPPRRRRRAARPARPDPRQRATPATSRRPFRRLLLHPARKRGPRERPCSTVGPCDALSIMETTICLPSRLVPSSRRSRPLRRRLGARHPAAGGATAGDSYAAAFRVGHACSGARSTTGITVRIPEGFSVQKAEPRAGWTLVDVAGQRLLARRLGAVRPARGRARRVRRPRHADREARHALVQGAAELRRRQRRLGRGPRRRDRQAGLSGGAARRARARRGRGRGARRLGALRGQGAERHRRLHDAGRALGRAPDRRLDAGGRPGRDPRDEDGRRRDADARRRRRDRPAAAPAGRAQARRLPPHADRPEEAAGRGRDRAVDPRVRRSRRSKGCRAAGRAGARRRRAGERRRGAAAHRH